MQLKFFCRGGGIGQGAKGTLHVSILNFSSPVHHKEKQSPCCLAHGLKTPLKLANGASLQSLLYPPAPRVPHVGQTEAQGKRGIYNMRVRPITRLHSVCQAAPTCRSLDQPRGPKTNHSFFFPPLSLLITILHSVKGNPLYFSLTKSFVYSNCCLQHFVAQSP